tara:strand:- start:752 stop:1186 length:435 start_codon:yes stop_codon:yes gene_type:complete
VYKIVEDKKKLQKACQEIEDINEGYDIGKKLLKALAQSNSGIGLAANQIGINKRVCVVNVTSPIIFINPKIVGAFGKTSFNEGCLSFPGESIITERYTNIIVQAHGIGSPKIFNSQKSILECICVQHEIDHLDGITMFERRYIK